MPINNMESKVEQIEQDRDVRGNTGTRTRKQESQYNYWFFTFNNYLVEQIEQIEQVFKHECKWYIFQEETGESGTPHLQGTICLQKKQRLTQLKHIEPSIHWEPTKSVKASIEYCTKYESRSGKIYSYGIKIPEPLDTIEPYGWQLDVMEIIKSKPDKRHIHWFWEPNGGVGKSELTCYLYDNHNALCVDGKGTDIFHALSKYPNRRKLIVVDVPKCNSGFINLGAIEKLKNGMVFSGKYDSDMVRFNRPHVIVFANIPPNLEDMTEGRFVIHRIT